MKNAIEKFMIMTEKIAGTVKISRNYETDVDIYRSEIHLIKLIGDYANLHVSEIARKLGVTKGAISQALKTLERKGLVEKYLDQSNNTRLLVKLTEKGQKVHLNHEEYHEKCDQDMYRYLNQLTDHELGIVVAFIEKTTEMATRHV